MSPSSHGRAAPHDGAALIRDCELSFDPGDKLNGSLYVCRAATTKSAATDAAIARLRTARLWSEQPVKLVAEEQKPAYAAQLQFVEAAAVMVAGEALVLARFDHPKFPSSAERFAAWRKTLAS